jgi:hypothetical protein
LSESHGENALPKFPLPIERGTFVLLKLQPGGKKNAQPVFYVGSIVCRVKNGWKIRCLRRKRGSTKCFTFPDREDESVYTDSDIVQVLESPKIMRSIHHFHEDFSVYASCLR